MTIKKIAVFTGTRAEYGLLYWLMKDIEAADQLQLQLIVSGAHLSELHGHTVDQIEADGFSIDWRIDLGLGEGDDRLHTAQATGRAVSGVAEALTELQSDLVILLGDRYELLGAASAALLVGIPIFHLHGGEVTEGAYDDAIRHSITKMATWHGVANEDYRQRVIQMGESPARVFTVGGLGLDNLHRLSLLDKRALESELAFRFGEKTIFVTYHPVTHAYSEDVGLSNLLTVLQAREDIHVMFTYPNADHGHQDLIEQVDRFVNAHPERSASWRSLGQLRYLSVLRYVDAVVGNSSSGIIEAPSFGVGTVNIGHRQAGRMRAASIIDCSEATADIDAVLNRVFDQDYKKQLATVENPYGNGGAAQKLVDIMTDLPILESGVKPFFDVSFSY